MKKAKTHKSKQEVVDFFLVSSQIETRERERETGLNVVIKCFNQCSNPHNLISITTYVLKKLYTEMLCICSACKAVERTAA